MLEQDHESVWNVSIVLMKITDADLFDCDEDESERQ